MKIKQHKVSIETNVKYLTAKTSKKKVYLFSLITVLLMCINTAQAVVIEQTCDQQQIRGENTELDGRLTLQVRTTITNDNILTTDKTIDKVEVFYSIHPGIYIPGNAYDWQFLPSPTTIIFSKHLTPAGSGSRIAQMMKDTRRNPFRPVVPWTWTFPSRYDYRNVSGGLNELGHGFFSGDLKYKSKTYTFAERRMVCSNTLKGTSQADYMQPLYSDKSIFTYSAKQNGKSPQVYWIDNENGGVFQTSWTDKKAFTQTQVNIQCPRNIDNTPSPLPVGSRPTDAGSATTTAPETPDNATAPDDICGAAVQLMELRDKELREMKKEGPND